MSQTEFMSDTGVYRNTSCPKNKVICEGDIALKTTIVCVADKDSQDWISFALSGFALTGFLTLSIYVAITLICFTEPNIDEGRGCCGREYCIQRNKIIFALLTAIMATAMLIMSSVALHVGLP